MGMLSRAPYFFLGTFIYGNSVYLRNTDNVILNGLYVPGLVITYFMYFLGFQ